MTDYAIVEHGGKQYRVSPGDELVVERTQADLKKGDDLVFESVMLVSQGDAVRVGQPTVDGAVVRSQVVAPVGGDKVIVFKKKRRKGYKKTQGHRQDYYRVLGEAIEGWGAAGRTKKDRARAATVATPTPSVSAPRSVTVRR